MKNFSMNEEENPLDDQFDDFDNNQVLQPIENLVLKKTQSDNTNNKDLFSNLKNDYLEEDIFQKKSRLSTKSGSKRNNKENTPRYDD